MTDGNPLAQLRGRRVLITGASSGIGAAAARAFGACGSSIAVHYNENESGARAVCAAVSGSGGMAIPLQKRLTQRQAGAELVAAAADALGGLDILINNAGDMLERIPLSEVTEEDLDRILDLNVRPVVSACTAAVPLLRKSDAGSIINVTSTSARTGASKGGNLYAAAKGFVATYTRGLARELASEGIRVNAVSPGIIDTPLHQRRTPPQQFAQLVGNIPLGRAGTPEECAGAFLFLSCPALGGYLTGQTVEVNGGQFMP